jgi:hypothetical protein
MLPFNVGAAEEHRTLDSYMIILMMDEDNGRSIVMTLYIYRER